MTELEFDSEGYTPLMWAARRGDDKAVNLLLEARACPNVRDIRISSTSLMQAASSSNLKCVRYLLQAGADPDSITDRQLAFMTDPSEIKISSANSMNLTPFTYIARSLSIAYMFASLKTAYNNTLKYDDSIVPRKRILRPSEILSMSQEEAARVAASPRIYALGGKLTIPVCLVVGALGQYDAPWKSKQELTYQRYELNTTSIFSFLYLVKSGTILRCTGPNPFVTIGRISTGALIGQVTYWAFYHLIIPETRFWSKKQC